MKSMLSKILLQLHHVCQQIHYFSPFPDSLTIKIRSQTSFLLYHISTSIYTKTEQENFNKPSAALPSFSPCMVQSCCALTAVIQRICHRMILVNQLFEVPQVRAFNQYLFHGFGP